MQAHASALASPRRPEPPRRTSAPPASPSASPNPVRCELLLCAPFFPPLLYSLSHDSSRAPRTDAHGHHGHPCPRSPRAPAPAVAVPPPSLASSATAARPRGCFSAAVAVVLTAGDFGGLGTNRGHHPTRLSGGVLTCLAARPPDGVGRTANAAVLQLTAGLTGLIRALITFPLSLSTGPRPVNQLKC